MHWGRLFRYLHLLLISIGMMASASVAHSAPAVFVKDVRLWASTDATRVVFDLSGRAKYTLTTLQNPDRVVVDIASARLEKEDLSMPRGRGFAKQLRAG